ncbi:YbaB/EbfC family nucleoid-associated protein [Kibdelosporangium aridum]|nr:YbaB/EbfC family nucleoid-associated protein [Kibdelosporangium aridum]
MNRGDMDGNILDPDSARERLAAWKGRIDKLAADTQAMSDQLREVRISVTDPNGLAEVTVDSTGALVDLRLTDRMSRSTPEAVSRAVMAAISEARNQLADRSQEIIAATVGTESAAAQAIAESVGRQLRSTPVEQPAPTTSVDDEDYDVRSDLWRK